MDRGGPELRDLTAGNRNVPPAARVIASGQEWSICEYTCRAGPENRPFEERHDGVTIAAVVEGSFTYRTDSGRALLHPGALLLGNHGKCFECGHDHSRGDRCIAFHFAPELFAEISASVAGTSRYQFPAATLPVAKHLTPIVAGLESLAQGASLLGVEETVSHVGETVVATLSGHPSSHARMSAREERRTADVVRFIEDHAAEPLDLGALAGISGSSKYHFLRAFRRAVGMTPYQFLLAIRIRRAALRLACTSETVASIAFGAGFGDLSTFNRRFRDLFGMSPSAYRRRGSAT
jgi:AraC family transcriptional regulator